jgi:predicted regulator of Ras-like GTPase activity (Roadblock/LC7/MglB family)
MHILQRSSPDVEAAALISLDGIVVASILLPEMSEERISAMSASILSLGEQISKETRRGTLEQVHIKGENGNLVLMAVGDQAVLTALVTIQAKMGILLLDMRHAADDLARILADVSQQ